MIGANNLDTLFMDDDKGFSPAIIVYIKRVERIKKRIRGLKKNYNYNSPNPHPSFNLNL